MQMDNCLFYNWLPQQKMELSISTGEEPPSASISECDIIEGKDLCVSPLYLESEQSHVLQETPALGERSSDLACDPANLRTPSTSSEKEGTELHQQQKGKIY